MPRGWSNECSAKKTKARTKVVWSKALAGPISLASKFGWSPAIHRTHGPQSLELLTHVRGVKQLEERKLLAAHPARLGGGHGGQEFPGMQGEERLLRFEPRLLKTAAPQGVAYPIPAHLAG